MQTTAQRKVSLKGDKMESLLDKELGIWKGPLMDLYWVFVLVCKMVS